MQKTHRQKTPKKQGGFIVTTELLLIATIMVIGLIVGMTAVRNATVAELEDVAEAIGSLNQSYDYSGLQQPGVPFARTAGSFYSDQRDDCFAPGFCSDRSPGGDGEYFQTLVPTLEGDPFPVP